VLGDEEAISHHLVFSGLAIIKAEMTGPAEIELIQ
jgi:hypothetical protein